jgi:hypothetical protein
LNKYRVNPFEFIHFDNTASDDFNETFHSYLPLVEALRKCLFGAECQIIQETKVLNIKPFCIPHHTMRPGLQEHVSTDGGHNTKN